MQDRVRKEKTSTDFLKEMYSGRKRQLGKQVLVLAEFFFQLSAGFVPAPTALYLERENANCIMWWFYKGPAGQ